MKKLLLALVLFPSFAFAADDAVECSKKHDGSVKCDVKKDKVVVDAIVVNGGDCPVSEKDKVLHHPYNKGDKFTVPGQSKDFPPGFDDCSYIREVTVKTHDGKKKTFDAM
ncbi:hypothetical protein [Methylocystis parvus]|uniref:Uncharacterized protein n=1 Tax=Methylocystis parvus TaxID=134 RepID=A0A6B8M835_9HYPH|nr:hypothetical protein [Methylocystis parvus]QGM98736.1 hypothetical protein F7D14_15445 [Methylocystis parvus]WBK00914.1 hypothetical protein MMG94_04115 [Methylocystis parvus OBBP]